MKTISRILILAITISLLFIISNNQFTNVSAESYEGSVGISFALNPTINVTVSGDLVISNLTPGDYKDSNNITVTASSNSIAGYSLYANTGSSSNNSNELRKDGTSTTNKFTSITTDVASLSDFTDNTWGYSYCNVSTNCATSTNWTNYSYLPKYSDSNDKLLIANNTNTTTSLEFKIGARASTNQIAGEYTNVINFIGIANPNPQVKTLDQVTTMQEPFSCTLTREGTTNTLTDTRDGNSYTVTKLKDGKCWMTTNLNLAGGTALSPDNTDVTSNYIDSFITSNNLVKSGDTLVLPVSSAAGFDVVNYSYVYNTGNNTDDCSSSGCYSYYSWDAATLGSGRSITTDNIDAPYSICPKGWALPSTGIDAVTDFRNFMVSLDGSASIASYSSSTNPTGATMYSRLIAPPYHFLLAGRYFYNSFQDGDSRGYYWSSTSSSDVLDARDLDFDPSAVYSAGGSRRHCGVSVRCVKSL